MKLPHEKIFVWHSRHSRYTIIIDAPNLRPVSSDLSWRDAFQTLNQTSKNVVRWFQLVQNDWTIPIHKIQRKCTLCLNSNIILRFQILSSQHSGQYFEIKRCITLVTYLYNNFMILQNAKGAVIQDTLRNHQRDESTDFSWFPQQQLFLPKNWPLLFVARRWRKVRKK